MGRALFTLAAATAVVVTLVVVDPVGARADASRLPHVTLIGDSVASAVSLDPNAARIAGQGVDLDLETAPCRRLEDPSCPPGPPTTVELIEKLGSAIGPTVVISVGYNDFADHYEAEIADTLDALAAADVKRIFWLTLRAAHHPYVDMNAEIIAAASTHPGMTVVDWNTYSRSHPEWFRDDGLHLLAGGEIAMAKLVHAQLVAAGVALLPVRVRTAALPPARRGQRYAARLAASSGRAPYVWSLQGRLPPGVRLGRSGTSAGTPRPADRRGTFRVTVRVTDAAGQAASRKLVLRLR
jgi:hypothetical protein